MSRAPVTIFPTRMFPPSAWQWRLAGAALAGGQPLAGAPQTADASAGGWWVATLDLGTLRREQTGVWRAIVGRLNSGVRLVEVELIDALKPAQRWLRAQRATWAGGALWSDGSEWVSAPIEAQLAAPAYMPAWPAPPTPPTQAQIQITTQGASLEGVEYFTVVGPSGRAWLHLIDGVWDVDDDVYSVSFTPPLRENLPSGWPVDFNRPRTTMKLDLKSAEKAWPMMTAPFLSKPTIGFVESGFPEPSQT